MNPLETISSVNDTPNQERSPLTLSEAQWEELLSLAKLEISREDRKALAWDLGLLRDFASSLPKQQGENVTGPYGEITPLREDKGTECLPRDALLAAAPCCDGEYIAVPPVFSAEKPAKEKAESKEEAV